MLKVKEITKYYGDLLAVDNLSFEINDGEIFGLLGVNGAGKTTTFRLILGLIDKNHGEITLDGEKIDYNNISNIGFLPEERSLLTKMTVLDQVVYYASLKGMEKDKILKELDYWLERFNITEYKDIKIKDLSKGNQQKIQFICAVIHNPKLIILDEPFSGLDPINVEMIMSAIRDLKKNGKMIIFSSHRMEHVELFCEKLIILVHGKSVLSGSINKIKKDYQKKNIHIVGDVNKEDLLNIKGVVDVSKISNEYIVKIENDSIVENVFKYIKKCENITKFSVEDATLNEIFIDKVGEKYE
ncbi:MAG: ATP-binding cassette domain-containing protein [Bacilli bacterium]|nr:ATP-binding cassette domain-containing protein [Bacilli bacterium]